MSEGAAKNSEIGGKLDSEKTKDIRMTNIIAARGMSISNIQFYQQS